MRLLIVEDEDDLADALARLLADAGFACDVARDGEEGLYRPSSSATTSSSST
jgi:DNA-binding response OmpR family regulator